MPPKNEIVKLNIGGTVFQTTVSTLTRFDGFFKTIMETDVPVIKDDIGSMFIDRSPKHFELILNFMRDGDVTIPSTKTEIDEISKEAQFYLLESLLELISKKLKFLESYDQVLEVVTHSEKPVLIIYHFVDNYGILQDFFYGLNAVEFVEKHRKNFDIYFKRYEADGPESKRAYRWQWTIYYRSRKYYDSSCRNVSVETLEEQMNEFLKNNLKI